MIHQLTCFKILLFISLCCCISCQTSPTPEPSLREQIMLEKDKGLKDWGTFPIGGAVNINRVLKDAKLEAITAKNFNSITATNDMKMYSLIQEEGKYTWDKVDKLVSFCEQHNQRLFGHALVWHYGAPEWIKAKATTEGKDWLDDFLKAYIQEVVGRYKGKVAAWDVVNEGFESAGGAYRKSFWYEQMGVDYIEKAFRYAHEVDPEAILFYNDFNIERDTAKLQGVLDMIKMLKAKNVPIGGLGFQMHIRMDTPEASIADALQKAAATGLQIHISELDIIFNKHDDTQGGGKQEVTELTDELREAQAQKYKSIVALYRTHVPKAQQYGITFWDFNDRDTWIKSFFKITDWPTVFDENLAPKPAYYGFAEGLIAPLK